MPTSLNDIKTKLSVRWNKGFFLKADEAGEELFPLRQPVKGPTSVELSERFDESRSWIGKLKSDCMNSGIDIEWKEINHRQLGRNSLPSHLIFQNIEQLAGFLGKKKELRLCREAFRLMTDAFPELTEWAAAHPFELIKNHYSLERLIRVLHRIKQQPRPGIYIRQLSIPGVDTKLIETHRRILSIWFDIILDNEHIDENYTGVSGFEQRYGFLSRPEPVRFRMLCPHPDLPFTDMTVPASEFAVWNPSVKRIFVVENDVTALAFPKVADSLLIFGRGYNFNCLSDAEWMRDKAIYYWGDIDTHGFNILSQFRGFFPDTKSFLMDRETLLAHREHWGTEPKPSAVIAPANLTEEEAGLYQELISDLIAPNLRLEQEFIDFSMLEDFIRAL